MQMGDRRTRDWRSQKWIREPEIRSLVPDSCLDASVPPCCRLVVALWPVDVTAQRAICRPHRPS
jgi:hypothetical protein